MTADSSAIQISAAGRGSESEEKAREAHLANVEHGEANNSEPPREHSSSEDGDHVTLGWRSWLVVLITVWGNIVQVYTSASIGTAIAFMIRDINQPGLAGWAIQGPLLVQSVLSPVVGRLSDVIGRKALVVGMPLISFAGACICAKSTDVNMIIGGSILTGFTLSILSIVEAIPSEVLPLKYRTIANGSAFLGGTFGGVIGSLTAGALTNQSSSGWRNTYWLQAALHLSASLTMLVGYFPTRRSDYERLSIKEYIWLCDPIGSFFFISGACLVLMALDWAPDTYPYSDPHVAATLAVGLALLVMFAAYEWKGRSDGLISHAYFRENNNFALSTFAFGVEGWIFYSAVNSIQPQMSLNLGWEDNSWRVSIRQLAFNCSTIFAVFPIVWYSTKYKDFRSPLIVAFVLFLVVTIYFAVVKPSESVSEYVILVVQGFGQAAPLTLLVGLVQFTAPHAFLSTATGLAFSARSIGGAFGSAVLNAIINGYISSHLVADVGSAAIAAGLPEGSVTDLVDAISAGAGYDAVKGINATILSAAEGQKNWTYAHAYRLAWSSIIPFVVLALVAVYFTTSVKHLMTDHVEATVERNFPENEKDAP